MQKRNSNSKIKSFRRAYRDEYADDFEAPGLLAHAGRTFSVIFKNWKLFGGLLLVVLISTTIVIGLFSQTSVTSFKESIKTTSEEISNGDIGEFAKSGLLLVSLLATGGLNQSLSGNQSIILVFIFLMIWLVSIYFLRNIIAKKKVTLRRGLYNAMTPLLSTLVILAVILIETLPIIVTMIFYSAALKTEFLTTPFYALIFIAFAAAMILLSCYLVSGSVFALVATTTPGLYPSDALHSTYDLVFGRRTKIVIRFIFLLFVLAVVCVIFMLPMILLDTWLKSIFDFLSDVPFISFCLLSVTCFNFIYTSAYIYLFYREMLGDDN